MTAPRGPHPAPPRLRRRGETLLSPQSLRAPSPDRRRFLQPGLPGASAGQEAWQALRPSSSPTRLHSLPLPPDRALPFLATLPVLPQAAIPLRLHGPGREPRDARPREHGDTGPAEGRSDRPHRAGAGPPRRALPPRFLLQSRLLPPDGGKPRERWREASLPRPHLLPARGWYLPRPRPSQLHSASGWPGASAKLSLPWSRWASQISLPLRPSPTGSNPRGFRSCAGIARCARSSAGTR